jgi:hypothetical protein
MKVIRDLLARDLNQHIEEIIKLDQTDQQAVFTEIREYVATERIKDQYRELFKAIASAPTDPTEGIAVWISGFFGSGKSSFAKNVGYALSNQNVMGYAAGTLFKEQVADTGISELVDYINVGIPTEVIMFDVSVDRAVKKNTERITEIMYTVLLRELGYAEDYDIAELEIELEKEGKLETFTTLCAQKYGAEWRLVRKGSTKFARASAILHTMEPETFPSQETWSQSLHNKSADITVGRFVERAFDLCALRKPGKALAFIIDEVGQYVARSGDKIEDLRAVVEQFGKESKNRLKAKKIIAPIWVMVTSQEKLDEVVAALDSKRVELAKLQDRFRHRIDMAPADIREVATRRVLAKTAEAEKLLQRLYQESQGQLNTACYLERTSRKSAVTQEDFVQFYPYLPHFIELSIDIVSGIRLQIHMNKHIGGSNRTIIKQAYEMLVSDRTALALMPIGTLVTLDKIFDLVEGNLSSEKQKDISDIEQRFKDDPQLHDITTRVAKVLVLLEFVHDLPRTENNIAACLISTVGQPAALKQVQEALEKLRQAQFVRNTEDGWKLQTTQEKNWDTERNSYEPKGKDRNNILRETLQDIFNDKIKTYQFYRLKSFRVGIKVNGASTGDEGQIPLVLYSADDQDTFQEKVAEIRNESRQDTHKNDLYWVFAPTQEIENMIIGIYASRLMIAKYDQLSAKNRVTPEEYASLMQESREVSMSQRRLRDKVTQALEQGIGLFRGSEKEAETLGKNLPDIIKKFLDYAVPDLYPKLEMGARSLRGTEAGEILKSVNLNTLSQVFYDGHQGLRLVIKEDLKYVLNPSADIAREILDYLKKEHVYGEKVTGKSLEEHFQGIGYGWDRDVLRLVLATLLRAGTIEVIYQGRRFRNHQDPQCRIPFENNVAFKAASFAPRESVGLKTLTTAVQYYEEITGEEVDVEEGAIAAAFKRVAEEESKRLLPTLAEARANNLPIQDTLNEYQHTLENIVLAASDDCVRTLAGEGKSFKETRNMVRKIREAINEPGLATIRRSRVAINTVWPDLKLHGDSQGLEYRDLLGKSKELSMLLQAPNFFEKIAQIQSNTQEIEAVYRKSYLNLHEQRAIAFAQAIEEIKGRTEWNETLQFALVPLASRMCKPQEEVAEREILPEGALYCNYCQATLRQIDFELAAVDSLKRQVITHIQELTAPRQETGRQTERIKILDFFDQTLETDEDVDAAVDRLRDYLHKKVAEGSIIIME